MISSDYGIGSEKIQKLKLTEFGSTAWSLQYIQNNELIAYDKNKSRLTLSSVVRSS